MVFWITELITVLLSEKIKISCLGYYVYSGYCQYNTKKIHLLGDSKTQKGKLYYGAYLHALFWWNRSLGGKKGAHS